jgi:hypothetical protein
MSVSWSDDLPKADISRIARATIAALEERTEELEAELDRQRENRNAWHTKADDFERELFAERQRREEAEEALREWENGYSAGWFYQHPDERPTARHFATYPAAEEKAGEG